uniref:Uncharacterized protein n=1 Tax=Romanomermis culicivorax TaxID=13658 RepID=A0A915K6R5_ROMCU
MFQDHEFLEQSRYRAVRVKDHEPVCKNEQEIRSCLTTTTPTETPIISIASDENFPQQQPVEEEINKIKKAQASVSSSSSGMVIGISVAAAVVALLTIGAAMLILAICRKKNKAVDEKNAEAGRKTDSRLERNSLAADFSRSNMRPAIRSTMDKNAKSSTKTRSKSKLTLPAPISAEDRQHYVALTPRKQELQKCLSFKQNGNYQLITWKRRVKQ